MEEDIMEENYQSQETFEVVEEAPKKDRTLLWILLLVLGVVILCCCAIAVVALSVFGIAGYTIQSSEAIGILAGIL
jgi:flagellar basal body-associated protein FliL